MPRAALVATLVCLLGLPAAAVAQETAASAPALGACERAHEAVPGAPVNVELATVTDTEFVVTWLTCRAGRPFPSDSTISYTARGRDAVRVVEEGPTAWHNVRVSGLRPGMTYRYTVSSNGIPALPDRLSPGVFTTLTPPRGPELLRVALLADIHEGEDISGLANSEPFEFPPGYSSTIDYPAVMLGGAIAGVNTEGADLTLVTADNTSHGELHDMEAARAALDGLIGDYLVARGSHDRPDQYDEAATECPPDADCFRSVFRPEVAAATQPKQLPDAATVGGWRFIALDSVNLETGAGEISADQITWLKSELRAARRDGLPSIVFFHHPVAEYSTTLSIPPLVFGVNQADASRVLRVMGRFDVRLVVNSHTHRNWIAYSPHTGDMPIIEVGPTKEYPAGYSVLRIYRGGLIREWFPIDCDFCNFWRETTRGEYFSLYPLYTMGSLRDRSFVHNFGGPNTPGIPSVPLGLWPPLTPGRA